MSGAGFRALIENKLGGTLGMLAPERSDSVVFFLPFGLRRPPIREDGLLLKRRTLRAGNGENRANSGGEWVGDGVFCVRDGKAEAAKIIVLIVVAVPAAGVLAKIERQDRAAIVLNRLGGVEDCFPRLIAKTRTRVNAPRSFVLPVDGVFDRAGNALLIG